MTDRTVEEAVLLMAGSGTRVRRITDGRSKLLLELSGQSLAERAVRWCVRQGTESLVLVVAPDHSSQFERLGRVMSDELGIGVEIVLQVSPSGTADALRCGMEVVSSENVLCLFADNIIPDALGPSSLSPLSSGRELRVFTSWCVDEIGELAVVVPEGDGRLSLRRKPHDLTEGHAVTGLFIIDTRSFRRHRSSVGPTGEHDLLDFVDECLATNSIEVVPLVGPWLDATSSVEAFARARTLLAKDQS